MCAAFECVLSFLVLCHSSACFTTGPECNTSRTSVIPRRGLFRLEHAGQSGKVSKMDSRHRARKRPVDNPQIRARRRAMSKTRFMALWYTAAEIGRNGERRFCNGIARVRD
jgi:hypothetical protein